MGCMGMGMDDFCRCTPSEFYAAYAAWHEYQDRLERGAWERVRIQCLCSLQPYSKKRIEAQDIMKFPWEEKSLSQVERKEELSREEIMARYREAKNRAGMT